MTLTVRQGELSRFAGYRLPYYGAASGVLERFSALPMPTSERGRMACGQIIADRVAHLLKEGRCAGTRIHVLVPLHFAQPASRGCDRGVATAPARAVQMTQVLSRLADLPMLYPRQFEQWSWLSGFVGGSVCTAVFFGVLMIGSSVSWLLASACTVVPCCGWLAYRQIKPSSSPPGCPLPGTMIQIDVSGRPLLRITCGSGSAWRSTHVLINTEHALSYDVASWWKGNGCGALRTAKFSRQPYLLLEPQRPLPRVIA